MKNMLLFPALTALALIAPLPASAEPTGYVAVGLGVVPEYEGSSDQQPIPFIAGKTTWDNHRYIALDGLSARANLLTSQAWEAGPVASFTFGRDNEVENALVAALAPIDDAVEIGGFVARTWSGVTAPGDEVRLSFQAVKDVTDTHDGWIATPAISYTRQVGNRTSLTWEASSNIVSDDYAQTYFAISDTDAAVSGLPGFEAQGGVKDVGLSFAWSYALNDSWALTGFSGYRRLLGDASDSPVTSVGGDANQFSAGLGVGWVF